MNAPTTNVISRVESVPGRPRVAGKFLQLGDEPFWIRGVTYGTFRAMPDGSEGFDPKLVARDFSAMAEIGINTIRTYTVPPTWLLDAAQKHGLKVMVGIPWEQHVTFLDSRQTRRAIVERVRAAARSCAGHPAILCYTVGNEVPGSIVRWHGHERLSNFLEDLYLVAKRADPDGLVSYVNFPTTEYLDLSFLDLICFNVFLECPERLEAYVARLQNLAGNKPLVLAELGVDSLGHGQERQAAMLETQLKTTFEAGCAGACVFSWTDEWHRSGIEVNDWAFGITDRNRQAKPSLKAVQNSYSQVPFPADQQWPSFSVIVCSHNGARTLRECLKGLSRLRYPDYEVIVVDDGSTDNTAQIAAECGFPPLSTEHKGLSHARNVGLRAAAGELVAYIDDDAWPSPRWLTYLASSFTRTSHSGVGGPNIAPSSAGLVGRGVASSPGWPNHVLLSDTEAEHIPGCNMAFRRDVLTSLGGFDVQFRTAGDDVDLCWRLRSRGLTLGFNAGAMVWHHPRAFLAAFYRQQRGYGSAEALLEKKWPELYNRAGHTSWAGRIYGNGHGSRIGRKSSIYHGRWGSAPFQSVYSGGDDGFTSLLKMPESYFLVAAAALLTLLGLSWPPLLYAGLPLLILGSGLLFFQAGRSAWRATRTEGLVSAKDRIRFFSVCTLLHLLQPLARLVGRLKNGLVPWRRRRNLPVAFPRRRRFKQWSERWSSAEDRLQAIRKKLLESGVAVLPGGDFDRWDLEIRAGTLGRVRLLMAIEEHGHGCQLVRFETWPKFFPAVLAVALLSMAASVTALLDRAWVPGGVLAALSVGLMVRSVLDCAAAMGAVVNAQARGGEKNAPGPSRPQSRE